MKQGIMDVTVTAEKFGVAHDVTVKVSYPFFENGAEAVEAGKIRDESHFPILANRALRVADQEPARQGLAKAIKAGKLDPDDVEACTAFVQKFLDERIWEPRGEAQAAVTDEMVEEVKTMSDEDLRAWLAENLKRKRATA